MELLKPLVTSTSATSVSISWSLPPNLANSIPYYGINCSTSSTFTEDQTAEESFLSRSQCTYYTVDNSTSSLRVAGLMPATNYMCCIEDSHGYAQGCVDVQTLEDTISGSGGVSGAVAGVVGGIIGALLVLAVLFTVAGIILGTLYFKKRQLTKAVSAPIARTHSKRYSHAAKEGTSLERKTGIKPGEAVDRSNSIPQSYEEQGSVKDITEQEDATYNLEDEDMGPLYASTSIPASSLRHILPGTEGKSGLMDVTESVETEQYEPMLALRGASPLYKNFPKGLSQGDIYINYPKRFS